MQIRYLPFILFALASCSGGFTAGSDINDGKAVGRTSYEFRVNLRHGDKGRDLFHKMYFAGDTLCFSLPVSVGADDEVNVFFVDGSSGREIEAERVEFTGEGIFGFSLVGSLLPFYRPDLLSLPAQSISFPFEVKYGLKVIIKGRASCKKEFSGVFKVDLSPD